MIASFFCSSTGIPGLLGQLILFTVATQAARNSLSAEGVRPEGSPEMEGLVVTHFVKMMIRETKNMIAKVLFIIDFIMIEWNNRLF